MTAEEFFDKITHIVDDARTPTQSEEWSNEYFEEILDWIRSMCDEQKQICTDNADTKDASGAFTYGMPYYIIDKESIINSPYPKELQ